MNSVLTRFQKISHKIFVAVQDDVRKAMGFVDMSAGAQGATVVYPSLNKFRKATFVHEDLG